MPIETGIGLLHMICQVILLLKSKKSGDRLISALFLGIFKKHNLAILKHAHVDLSTNDFCVENIGTNQLHGFFLEYMEIFWRGSKNYRRFFGGISLGDFWVDLWGRCW